MADPSEDRLTWGPKPDPGGMMERLVTWGRPFPRPHPEQPLLVARAAVGITEHAVATSSALRNFGCFDILEPFRRLRELYLPRAVAYRKRDARLRP